MVSRRDVLKLAVASATLPLSLKLFRNTAQAVESATTDSKFVPSICAMCPSACGILAEVRNGKIHRIHGNPFHPTNEGKICARGNAGVERVYNPDRIKKPLIRTGEKGKWAFREVSWDEAISLIVEKIREIGDTKQIGVLGGWFVCKYYKPFFKAFLKVLGTPNGTGIPTAGCFIAKTLGWKSAYGFGSHPEILTDYENARMLIVLRRNIAGSISIVHAKRFAEGRKNFKLVVLDPRFSETAAKADLWLPIKPGTDLAFLLAMMNVIVREGLYDKEFLSKHTNAPMLLKDNKPFKVWDANGKKAYLVYDLAKGKAVEHSQAMMPVLEGEYEVDGNKVKPVFQVFKEIVANYTPEWAERITDIPAETIETVAREFALKRGVVDTGWHDPKYANSVMTWRACALLNALVGSVNSIGGLLFTGYAQYVSINAPPPKAPENSVMVQWAKEKGVKFTALNHTYQAFYDAIVNEKPYPIKMLFAFACNILNNLPDRKKWEKALQKLDFFVAVDILPQDHLYYADVILPEHTYLEKDDPLFPITYAPAFGFHTRVKAIEPLYDTKHTIDIVVEIAKALGKEDVYFKTLASLLGLDAEKLKSYYHSEGVAGIRRLQAESKGLDYNEILTKGCVVKVDKEKLYYTMPYKKPLPTPTGKVEFYSFMLAKLGINPIIEWIPPKVMPSNGELRLVYGRSPLTTHSSTTDNPLLAKLIEDSELFYKGVWINPKTAEKLGIKNGDRIILESAVGKTEGIAFVTDLVREDTAFVVSGFGQRSEKLSFAPKKLPSFMELCPLQVDTFSGAVMNHEFVVRIRKVM